MKNYHIWIVFLFLLTFLVLNVNIGSATSSLPIQKINSCVNLPQFCATCGFVTLASVQLPNSSYVNINQNMTRSGSNYNYTFCQTDLQGTYIVNTVPDGNITAPYDFMVNPLGKTFTNSQAILYFLVFFVSMIFFLICSYFGISAPYKNKKDQMTGYVIAVENLKYLKMFLIAISYLMLVLMSYFGWMISYGYLDLEVLGKLFNFTFYGLLYMTLPLFIVGVFVVISNAVRDSKVSEMLLRGFRIK